MLHRRFVLSTVLTALLPFVSAAQPGMPPPGTPAAQAERKLPTPEELAALQGGGNPVVLIRTSKGNIKIELDGAKAPLTVANFMRYVDEGFYSGTIFHRVIDSFMIQGGGFTKDFQQKPTHEPVKNEAANGLQNKRGTIAMARTGVVDSGTAQFFINVVDNGFLDYQGPTPEKFGYCVFGKVVEGMDVVDAIKAVPTGRGGPFEKDVPQETIEILEATRSTR